MWGIRTLNLNVVASTRTTLHLLFFPNFPETTSKNWIAASIFLYLRFLRFLRFLPPCSGSRKRRPWEIIWNVVLLFSRHPPKNHLRSPPSGTFSANFRVYCCKPTIFANLSSKLIQNLPDCDNSDKHIFFFREVNSKRQFPKSSWIVHIGVNNVGKATR